MRHRRNVTTTCHIPRLAPLLLLWGCLLLAAVPSRLAVAQDAPPLLSTAVQGVDATTDILLDFILPSGFVFSGTVQNADGSPVFFGTITAQSEAQTFSGDASFLTSPVTYRLVLPLPGTVLISGTVIDALGQPVAGAAVSAATSLITNTPNAVFTTKTETDSTGRYALLTLSGTSYTLVVCPPFFDPLAGATGP